jgi:fibronectin-binding autotransporter adhesin
MKFIGSGWRLMVWLSVAPVASAQLYWDTNGNTAGSGNAGGSWDGGTNWSTDAAGSSATVGWTNGNTAIFSAGTDGTGTLNITAVGGVTATGVTVQEGTVVLNSIAINNTGQTRLDATVGTLTLAGTTAITGTTYLRNNTASTTSTLNIQDSAVISTSGAGGYIAFGDQANAAITINQSGGSVTNLGTINNPGGNNVSNRWGHWGGGTTNYNLSGGTLNLTGAPLYLSWDGAATLNITGGTANIQGFNMGFGTRTQSSTITVGGTGRLNVGSDGIVTGGTTNKTINLSGGTLGAFANWATSRPINVTANSTINTLDSVDNTTGRTITLSGVLSGVGGLTKTGAGTLLLSSSNTFTGNTTISGGVLELSGTGKLYNAAFNNTAVITVDSTGTWRMPDYSYGGVGQLADNRQRRVLNGGTIEVTGNSHSSGQDFTVTSSGGTFRYTPAGQTLTLNGNANTNINTSGNLTFDTGGNITLAGTTAIIEGTGGLTKTGAGTLLLSSSNTFTGNTTISGGVLELSGTGKLYNAGYNNTAVITVDSTGTWRMPDYSYAGVGQLADYRQRRVLNGGTIEVTGNSHSSGQDFTVTSAGGTFRYTPVGQTLTLNGNGNTNINTSGNLTFDTGGNITLAGATAIIEGTGGLTKTGAGTLTLEGQHTYSGSTSFSGGLVKLNTGQIYSSNAWVNRSISISGGAIVEIGGWADGDTTVQKAGFGQVSFNAGNLVVNNGTIRYTGSQTNGAADRGFTIGAGGATLQAEGTNNFTLNQGRGFGVGSAAGGTLTLGGSKNGVWNMILGGTGGLVKADAGTWTVSNANTFTGGTVVDAGVLNLTYASGGNAAIRGTVTVKSGAELRVSGGDGTGLGYGSSTGGQKIGTINIEGGLLNATENSHLYYATVNMTAGTLQIASGKEFEFGNVSVNTLASASTATMGGKFNIRGDAWNGLTPLLSFNVADGTAATDLLVSGVISERFGTGALTKSGAGLMRLTAANTYTGATTVNGGELRIDGSITSNVTVNNGATLSGTGTITGNMTFGAGSVFAPGASPGIINQVGNLVLNAGSTFLVDVWNSPTAPFSDQVNLTGELDINNATIETLWGGGADNIFRGGSPNANQMVWLVLNDGGDTIDGTFLNDGDTVNTGLLGLFGGGSPYLVSSGGVNYALFYNANHTGAGLGTISGGNDLLLIAIPEPSRALFLLLALLPFALRRTRVG